MNGADAARSIEVASPIRGRCTRALTAFFLEQVRGPRVWRPGSRYSARRATAPGGIHAVAFGSRYNHVIKVARLSEQRIHLSVSVQCSRRIGRVEGSRAPV
jgi:hypothetical protein